MKRILQDHRIGLAALALSVTLVLTLTLRDFARDVIVVPIAQFLWLTNLYLRAIPQPVLWGIFLTATLYVAVGSLSENKTRRRRRKEPPLAYSGPVETELKWVRLSAHGNYGRWRLAQRLTDLAATALALCAHEAESEVKRSLARGAWEAPPEMKRYFRAGLGPPITRPGFLWPRRSAAELRNHPLRTTSPRDVIAFIEQELEEEHGR